MIGTRFGIINFLGYRNSTASILVGTGRAAIPFLGGTFLVQPPRSAIVLGLNASGGATLPIDIPADPGLVGLVLDIQAGIADPGAGFGVSMTNGLEISIG